MGMTTSGKTCHLRPVFSSIVIFGLAPEIQEKRSPYHPVHPNILELCAMLTRSLCSGPPVGVAFAPRFRGNDRRV